MGGMGLVGQSVGYAQSPDMTPNKLSEATQVDALRADMNRRTNRIHMAAERLEGLGDRLYGERPPSPATISRGETAYLAGKMGEVASAGVETDVALIRLEDAIARFSDLA